MSCGSVILHPSLPIIESTCSIPSVSSTKQINSARLESGLNPILQGFFLSATPSIETLQTVLCAFPPPACSLWGEAAGAGAACAPPLARAAARPGVTSVASLSKSSSPLARRGRPAPPSLERSWQREGTDARGRGRGRRRLAGTAAATGTATKRSRHRRRRRRRRRRAQRRRR